MPGGVALISLETAREYMDKENRLIESTKLLDVRGMSPVSLTMALSHAAPARSSHVRIPSCERVSSSLAVGVLEFACIRN